MIKFETLEISELQKNVDQTGTITVTTEEYSILVRESEKLKILRNMMWFSNDKYSSNYHISSKAAAAIFDDEEFLFGDDRLAFCKKIASLVHNSSDPERKEST